MRTRAVNDKFPQFPNPGDTSPREDSVSPREQELVENAERLAKRIRDIEESRFKINEERESCHYDSTPTSPGEDFYIITSDDELDLHDIAIASLHAFHAKKKPKFNDNI